MSLLNIPLADITADTIKTLIESDPGTNKESLTLDFKAETQLESESHKQKMLKWVVSFANTAGGDLLIGIKQNESAYEIVGLDASVDSDRLQQQVSNIVNLNVEPKLSRPVEFRELEVDGAKVLIVRTHQSFNKPHGIKVNDGYKFFVRLPNGQSVPMDIQQVRSAFIGSETLIQRIKAFKADRIGSLLSGNVQFELTLEAKMVIHIIPLEAFSQGLYIDPQQYSSTARELLMPLGATGWNHRYNLEGFATYAAETRQESGLTYSYVQVFRDGAIEFVSMAGRDRSIPSVAYEKRISDAVTRSFKLYKQLNIGLPCFVSVTFLGIKGFTLGVGTVTAMFQEPIPIDRDVISLPDIRIDSPDADIFKALKPAFDTLWQCFDYDGCLNFGPDGEWAQNRRY